MQESPFPLGHVLAEKYRIEGLLGSGGHGVVLSAHHLALNERVAIKILRPEVATDQDAVSRFLREARASVRIKGEHVTRVLDVGSLDTGIPYMVMEHLNGQDLSSYISTSGQLEVTQAVDFVIQACEALAEAHALGIVHRDIKPSNLFWTTRPDGTPCIKVLDFGISKAMPNIDANEASLTQTQTILGSPQYMAPEQMRSSKRVDGRTDIWALGTTLHELVTGKPPFEAETMPELFAMILQDPPPPLVEKRPDSPPALQNVVNRCMEKEADRRYADVQDLALALMPFASPAGVVSAERVNRVGGKPRPIPLSTPPPAPAPAITPAARAPSASVPPEPAAAASGKQGGTTWGSTTGLPQPAVPMNRTPLAVLGIAGVVVTLGIVGWVTTHREGGTPPPGAGIVSTSVPMPESVAIPSVVPVSPATPTALPGPSAGTSIAAGAAPSSVIPSTPHVTAAVVAPSARPQHSASAAASLAPPPVTPPPPASTSRPPGVASSRYD